MMGNYSLYSLGLNLLIDDEYMLLDQLPANISYSLNHEASYAVFTVSLLNFSILFMFLVFYYMRDDDQISSLGSPNNLILMFVGLIMSATTTLSIPKYDMKLYRVYLIILIMLVGIIVTVLGSRLFFRAPKNNDEKPIGYQHDNISLIIWIITIPLVLMELLEFIGALAYQHGDYKYKATVDIIELSQKLLQASVYHFSLRYKIPREGKTQGACWYLRILSLFNFAMWVDAMISVDNEYIVLMFGRGWSVVSTAMIALLIDYHLLCCMVFAEHSLEMGVGGEEDVTNAHGRVVVADATNFKIRAAQFNGLGHVFGFTILALQLVCGLQNFGVVGVWSNVFSIVADIFVVVLGLLLLRLDVSPKNLKRQWRKSDAKGMDLMVALMGVTGLLYWIIMTVFNAAWVSRVDILDAKSISYLKWCCAKNVCRSIGIIFQLGIFIKCDPLFGHRDNVKGKIAIYFILPALMFSFLSVFVMAIMDGHSKIVEDLVESSGISSILITLMKISEPLYLGYTLHLFLHFYIVFSNVKSLEISSRKGENGAMEMNPLVT